MCRLSALGFPQVHDYVPGKVDWLARNLPVHGTGAGIPTIGRHLRHDVVTATPWDTLERVHARVAHSAHRFALVTSTEAILLGRLRGTTLASPDPASAVVEVMEPGPSTLRLSTAPTRTRHRGAPPAGGPGPALCDRHRPDGRLLGTVHRADLP